MKVKTSVKSGGLSFNRCETLATDVKKSSGLRVKTNVKSGGLSFNRCETLVRD